MDTVPLSLCVCSFGSKYTINNFKQLQIFYCQKLTLSNIIVSVFIMYDLTFFNHISKNSLFSMFKDN